MFLSNKCTYCEGAGDWLEEDYNGAEHWVKCFACDGRGYLEEADEFWEPVEDPHWEEPQEEIEERVLRLADGPFKDYVEDVAAQVETWEDWKKDFSGVPFRSFDSKDK